MAKEIILTWNADGSKPIYKKVELTPYRGVENVYTTPYYNENLLLVFKFVEGDKTLYKTEGSYSERSLFGEHKIRDIERIMKEHLELYLDNVPNRKFVSLGDIEAWKALGRDITPLLARRQEIAEERQRRAEEETRLYLEKQAAAEATEIIRLEAEEKKFAAGEKITVEDFISLCKSNGVAIAIQTIGAMRTWGTNSRIGPKQMLAYLPKGKKIGQGAWDSANDLHIALQQKNA